MEILESVKRLMLAGLGVPEKLKEVADDLVKKGEINETQAKKLIDEWSNKAEKGATDISEAINDTVKKALEKMNLPSRDEVEALRKEVKALTDKLDSGSSGN